jgi:hypothetical protein
MLTFPQTSPRWAPVVAATRLCVAALVGCGVAVHSSLDDAGHRDASREIDGAPGTDDAGLCTNVVPEGGNSCAPCQGYWYCPLGAPPLIACPEGDAGPGNGSGGACDYDGPTCYSCDVGQGVGAIFSCEPDGDANAGDDGHTWLGIASGYACSQ